MKIDVTPTIEKANDLDKECITMRGIDALYYVKLANGTRYSIKWDAKGLGEFQPSKTVSEMLKSWEANIISRYEIAKKAIESGFHPTRMKQILVSTTEYFMDTKKHWEEGDEPAKLNSYERKHFKLMMVHREKEFGALTFVQVQS